MQEYVQKSTSTTLPRSCAHRQRRAVHPRRRSRRSPAPGRSPAGPRSRSSLRASGPAFGDVRRPLERVPARRARLRVLLQEVGVVREPASGAFVSRLKTSAKAAAARTTPKAIAEALDAGAQPRARAAAAERDREQHERDADRVGDRDRDRLEAEVASAAAELVTNADRRAAAGDEDEAERAAEQEAAAEVAGRAAREARERTLDQDADLGDDQRQRRAGRAGRSRRCGAGRSAGRARRAARRRTGSRRGSRRRARR